MVDINLFKEDEEEEGWKATPEEGEGPGSDRGEGLGSEEDIWESSSLDDQDLLSDEEAVPDLEDAERGEPEEDYEFGDVTRRKTSVWLWVFLGVVLVGVSLYLFVLRPRQVGMKEVATYVGKRPSVSDEVGEEDTSEESIRDDSRADEEGERSAGPIAAVVDSDPLRMIGSVTAAVEASRAVFEDLTRHDQFGAFLLTGNRFYVEYVSETPGVANAMGHRIQTLLGSSGFKVSPEERHRTAGRIHYWGVVSGELPRKAPSVSTAISGRRFASADSFIDGFKDFVSQHQMTVRGFQKLSESFQGNVKKTCVRVKVEGTQTPALAFLESLKGFQGSSGLAKLLLAPANYSDFKANRVKLVLDFFVPVG